MDEVLWLLQHQSQTPSTLHGQFFVLRAYTLTTHLDTYLYDNLFVQFLPSTAQSVPATTRQQPQLACSVHSEFVSLESVLLKAHVLVKDTLFLGEIDEVVQLRMRAPCQCEPRRHVLLEYTLMLDQNAQLWLLEVKHCDGMPASLGAESAPHAWHRKMLTRQLRSLVADAHSTSTTPQPVAQLASAERACSVQHFISIDSPQFAAAHGELPCHGSFAAVKRELSALFKRHEHVMQLHKVVAHLDMYGADELHADASCACSTSDDRCNFDAADDSCLDRLPSTSQKCPSAAYLNSLLCNDAISHRVDQNAKALLCYLESSLGQTILHLAVANSMCAAATYLLDLTDRAHVNLRDAMGTTPLLCAAHANSLPCVTLLLAHGADVCAADDTGVTALHHAASHNNVNAMRLLRAHGACIDAICSSGTPLHWAASEGALEALQDLLQWGAAIDTLDAEGSTPLLMAAVAGHEDVVVELVHAHANASSAQLGGTGLNVLHICVDSGMQRAVKALLETAQGRCCAHDSPLKPIHMAAVNDDEQMFSLLKDVSCINRSMSMEDVRSEASTHSCQAFGDIRCHVSIQDEFVFSPPVPSSRSSSAQACGFSGLRIRTHSVGDSLASFGMSPTPTPQSVACGKRASASASVSSAGAHDSGLKTSSAPAPQHSRQYEMKPFIS